MKKKLFLLTGTFLIISSTILAQVGCFTEPIKIDSTINSLGEESSPIFSKNGDTLFFTRAFDASNLGGIYDQDIWFSYKLNGVFQPAINLRSLNNKLNNSIFGISNDGKLLYVLDNYRRKKRRNIGIAISNKKGDNWVKPIEYNLPSVENKGSFLGFHINETRNVIILSMKGESSIGEEDLYFSIKEDEQWSSPVHMGNVINSNGFEISPFLSVTSDTLFFSSNGFGGEGDADIFYSIRKNDSWTDWTPPTNLGNVINSSKYDAFFSYNSSKNCFWVSNKDSERTDIYIATMMPATTLFAEMFPNTSTVYGEISLDLDLEDKSYTIEWENGEKTPNLFNLSTGNYTAIIKDNCGQSVKVNYEVKAPIEVVEEKKTVNTEFTIEEFEVLFKDVKPIYFEIGKYGIRFDASKELDKIVKIMNENPTLEIELGSHTDCLSNDELNLVLSHNRAKSTAEYIKRRISHPERINGKGYGESRPKIDCDCSQEVASKKKCSESDNQLNRRTEFIMKSEKSELIEDISLLPYRTYTNKINKDTSLEKNNSNINSSELVDEKNKSLNTSKFRTDITLSEEQKLNISKGFYILQEGETLYRASINTQVPIQQIRKLNNLKSNNVYPGTKLLLK